VVDGRGRVLADGRPTWKRDADGSPALGSSGIGSIMRRSAERSANIGLSDRDADRFSFLRALNALANPNNHSAQAAAGFEYEVSRAASDRMGVIPRGILVPNEVLRRDLQTSVFSQGGALVGTDVPTGSLIELLRNRLVLAQVGARVLDGLIGNVGIPRQTGAATAYWISPEGGSPTESEQQFGQVSLTPKTVGAFTDMSRQLLLQTSAAVEGFVRDDLARVLALAIDQAAIYGSGVAGQPLGVFNTAGVNTKDFAAANPTYAELVAMESLVAADNADVGALAYVVEPAMRGTLKGTEKFSSTGQTVWEPGNTINGYPAAVSGQLTAGDVLFGNWADLLIGMWGALDLMVDPYANSKAGSVRVVALQSVDVALRNAVSFCIGNDDQ
jgi:HK97 family phage major capsid protein